MAISLVVFDFDGTLVDSEPGIVRSMERAVEALGLPPETVAAWRELIGLPVAAQLERLLPAERRGEVAQGVALYRSFYFQLSPDEMGRPFPGVPEMLADLRGRAKLAIATSKGQRGLQRVLDHLGWGPLFDVVITPEVVVHPKPHPESIERIRSQLGVAAGDTIAIGDSRYDIEMAAAAGVIPWAANWGVHRADVLVAAGARRCFETPSALHEALVEAIGG